MAAACGDLVGKTGDKDNDDNPTDAGGVCDAAKVMECAAAAAAAAAADEDVTDAPLPPTTPPPPPTAAAAAAAADMRETKEEMPISGGEPGEKN